MLHGKTQCAGRREARGELSRVGIMMGLLVLAVLAGQAQAQYLFDDINTLLPSSTLHFAEDGASSAINGINRPPAVCFNNKTYVTYQGVNNAPMVTVYDHIKKEWGPIVKAGTSPLGDTDTHGAPSMVIDKEGYLHIFFGSHGGKQVYVKSRKPEDITDWMEMPPIHGSMTYPNAAALESGELVMIGRTGGGHKAPWSEISSKDGGKTWNKPKAILNYHPNGIYAATAVGPNNKTFHLGWSLDDLQINARYARMGIARKKKGPWDYVADARRHAFYAMRDENGVWRNVQGQALQTPLNLEQSFEKCLVYRGDWPEHGNYPIVEVSPDGRPSMMFLNGRLPDDPKLWTLDTVSYDQNFARWDGKKWVITKVTETDMMWDSGHAIFFGPEKNQVDVYLVAGGSRINGKNTTLGRRGGDIQHWRSMDDGKSWEQQADVITFLQTGRLFIHPTRVVNCHPDGKFVFVNFATDKGYRSNDFRHNAYLYGDSGFCRKDPKKFRSK